MTHDAPWNPIWTLAAGISEGRNGWDCPCIDPGHTNNVFPPSFVGNNYYYESGNPTDSGAGIILYATDPLWDGQQCEGECCSNGKFPPWFYPTQHLIILRFIYVYLKEVLMVLSTSYLICMFSE